MSSHEHTTNVLRYESVQYRQRRQVPPPISDDEVETVVLVHRVYGCECGAADAIRSETLQVPLDEWRSQEEAAMVAALAEHRAAEASAAGNRIQG